MIIKCCLPSAGGKSKRLSWQELVAYDADVILIAPCGMDRKRAATDGNRMWRHEWWRELRAVKDGQVRPLRSRASLPPPPSLRLSVGDIFRDCCCWCSRRRRRLRRRRRHCCCCCCFFFFFLCGRVSFGLIFVLFIQLGWFSSPFACCCSFCYSCFASAFAAAAAAAAAAAGGSDRSTLTIG